MISTLKNICNNKPLTKNDASCIQHNEQALTIMMHLVFIIRQMTNDANCTQPSLPKGTASYLDEKGKCSYRIYLDKLKTFACVRWSFGQAYNDSFVCLLEAQTKWQLGSNANNKKSWLKRLIVSKYSRIQYFILDPPKTGHDSITNVISNTYRTISVNPYCELMH
jgi:hypothetical protein